MVVKEFLEGWKFHLQEVNEDCEHAFEKEYEDISWENVTLPHDWSVHYPMSKEYSSGTGYVKGGIGWYRKLFLLEEIKKGSTCFLRFDGIYKNSQVWINGYYLGKHAYGYTTFQYDISDFLSVGENVISVKVSHTDIADSRWFTGSGITRKVMFLSYESLYPKLGDVFCYSKDVTEQQAKIAIEAKLYAKESQTINVVAQMFDKNNVLVMKEEKNVLFQAEQSHDISFESHIKEPVQWSFENPYLYTLKLVAINSDTKQESLIYEGKTGIRSVDFDPEAGFFLNGKHTILKGVCVHHDGGCLGSAMTKGVWRRRLQKLKYMGCNAIRMSHNPHMPELYDLCDEMGFLVIDEAFDEWEAAKNKWHKGHNVYPPKLEGYAYDFKECYRSDLESMIKRDRNHASVILWSIGNEIDYPNDPYNHPLFESMEGNNDANKPKEEQTYNKNRPNAERLPIIAKELAKICKETDPTRLVTAAVAFPELSTRIGYLDSLDVVGYNYKEHLYEMDHQRFPLKPFMGSENGHSYEAWMAVEKNSYISGQFLWTGIDYLGECRGWPYHGSTAGLLTTAGFEKTSYLRRKSLWTSEPFLALATARKNEDTGEWKTMQQTWNYINGEEIEVRCYSNQSDVKFYINDKEVDEINQTSEFGYISICIPFEAGGLKAVSVSANAKATLETTSAAVAIKLHKVSEEDLIQIEVSVIDREARSVIEGAYKIEFMLQGDGEIVGIDNGDLSDVTDYTSRERMTYEGNLIVYIRRRGSSPIILSATSQFLKTDKIVID